MVEDNGNRIAPVTGANKGIGREISRQLGKQGMTVLVGARDEIRGQEAVAELKAGGADARFPRIDVTDEAAIDAAVKQIEQEFGRLDVLVNNAGIWVEGIRPADEVTVEEMRRTYEVNVFGVVAVTNAMLPLLRRSSAARVVNMATRLGSLTLTADPENPVAGMGRSPTTRRRPRWNRSP